jgi:hypothetical protein
VARVVITYNPVKDRFAAEALVRRTVEVHHVMRDVGYDADILAFDWAGFFAAGETNRIRTALGLEKIAGGPVMDDMAISLIEHADELKYVDPEFQNGSLVPFVDDWRMRCAPRAVFAWGDHCRSDRHDPLFAREVRFSFGVHLGPAIHRLAVDCGASQPAVQSGVSSLDLADLVLCEAYSLRGRARDTAHRRLYDQNGFLWGDYQQVGNWSRRIGRMVEAGLMAANGDLRVMTPRGTDWFSKVDRALYSDGLYEELCSIRQSDSALWTQKLGATFSRLAEQQKRRSE